jgi:hypothetical protein
MSQLKVDTITDEAGTGSPSLPNGLTVGGVNYPSTGPLSNRNKIINGAMVIDQRNAGAAVTIPAPGLVYSVDRFYGFALGANATAQRVSSGISEFPFALRLTGASGNTYLETGQRIESANCADLVGKQVTLSFTAASSSLSAISCALVRASVGVDNFNSTAEIQSISQPITSTLTRYSVIFNALPSTAADGIAISFIAGSGLAASETITITGVQLEAGTVATPFEHRSFGQELALCLRYYYDISSEGTGGGFGNLNMFRYADGQNVYAAIENHPVYMRAGPTITFESGLRVHLPSVAVEAGTFSANRATPARFNISVTPGTTNDSTIKVAYPDGDGAAVRRIFFSAEL